MNVERALEWFSTERYVKRIAIFATAMVAAVSALTAINAWTHDLFAVLLSIFSMAAWVGLAIFYWCRWVTLKTKRQANYQSPFLIISVTKKPIKTKGD